MRKTTCSSGLSKSSYPMGILALGLLACGSGNGGNGATTGAGGATAPPTTGYGGAIGSGGSTAAASGGAVGTGGHTTGAGGAPASGGTTSAAGTGGANGTGGTTTGMAGMGMGGMGMGGMGMGGMMMARGGAPGMGGRIVGSGGMMMGMGGMHGAGGMVMGTGGSTAADAGASCRAPGTLQVVNSGMTAYMIDGVANPDLTFCRGSTYVFAVNATGHPFYVKTVQSTGTANAYTMGVMGNGATAGDVTFAVPTTAPATLFYDCSIHAAMTGTIHIVN